MIHRASHKADVTNYRDELPATDSTRVAEIKEDVARALATHPHIVMALLQQFSSSLATESPDTIIGEPISEDPLTVDTFIGVSPTNLGPLAAIRRETQTIQLQISQSSCLWYSSTFGKKKTSQELASKTVSIIHASVFTEN